MIALDSRARKGQGVGGGSMNDLEERSRGIERIRGKEDGNTDYSGMVQTQSETCCTMCKRS